MNKYFFLALQYWPDIRPFIHRRVKHSVNHARQQPTRVKFVASVDFQLNLCGKNYEHVMVGERDLWIIIC